MITLIRQFIHFLGISGIGWGIDFSIFYVLTEKLGLNVVIGNIISSIPAITFVFFSATKKTFSANINSRLNLKQKYVLFLLCQGVLLLFVSVLGEFIYRIIKRMDYPYIGEFIFIHGKLLSKILITPITMTLNFIIMKNLSEKL